VTIIRNGELMGSIYWPDVPADLLPDDRVAKPAAAADPSDTDEVSEGEPADEPAAESKPRKKSVKQTPSKTEPEPEQEPGFDPHGVPEPGPTQPEDEPKETDLLESLTKKD
jgi:hypothetical protein